MSVGEALCPGDVFQVPRGVLLVSGPADRGQALWIVDLVIRRPEGSGELSWSLGDGAVRRRGLTGL
jgi:hypothetical protein